MEVLQHHGGERLFGVDAFTMGLPVAHTEWETGSIGVVLRRLRAPCEVWGGISA